MTLQVIWSVRARNTYVKIAEFILQKWSQKEVQKFADLAAKSILQIAKNPEMSAMSAKKHVRRRVISKQTSLYYTVQKNSVILVAFRDNLQDPKKLKL